jgi:preprotein translocase subunit YajC
MNNLKKGDRIITKSGIHAKVVEINDKDNTCTIETQAGKLKVERTAISLEMSAKLIKSLSKKVIKPRFYGVFFKTRIDILCIRIS